ncbi:MAG: DUF4381 family protein [Burkholderiales bacterium]|nr:DUF4381 family protein [Burkholderiales bacterium]
MIELADIIAPIAPPTAPPPYEWIALGVALFALILFFMLRLWLKRTRARRWARAALKRTERELKLGKLDARAAAFQIAWALRDEYPNKRPPQTTLLQGTTIYTGMQSSAEPASPPLAGSLQSSGVPTGVPLAGAKGEEGGFKSCDDASKSPPPPLFQRGEVLRKYLCLRGGRRMDALNSEAWSDFLQTLDRARFSPHPIDTQQAAQLLAQAHQWIGRAP